MEPSTFSSRPLGAHSMTDELAAACVSTAFAQVFLWMAVGLFLTACTALTVVFVAPLQDFIFGNQFVYYGLLFSPLALVWFLSAKLHSLSWGTAITLFLGYAALNGLTLSAVVLVYTASSIASTFFIASGMFGAMALYGIMTKRDLSSWGSFLFMGLIGVIIAAVVNIFLQSSMLSWIFSMSGIVVFVGLTAYDTNKIKNIALSNSMPMGKLAIYGALALYLDFINLFLMLLRFFGDRRN